MQILFYKIFYEKIYEKDYCTKFPRYILFFFFRSLCEKFLQNSKYLSFFFTEYKVISTQSIRVHRATDINT